MKICLWPNFLAEIFKSGRWRRNKQCSAQISTGLGNCLCTFFWQISRKTFWPFRHVLLQSQSLDPLQFFVSFPAEEFDSPPPHTHSRSMRRKQTDFPVNWRLANYKIYVGRMWEIYVICSALKARQNALGLFGMYGMETKRTILKLGNSHLVAIDVSHAQSRSSQPWCQDCGARGSLLRDVLGLVDCAAGEPEPVGAPPPHCRPLHDVPFSSLSRSP